MKRILLDEVDSTSHYIAENIKNFTDDTLVIAKHQTNGKGQFDRAWFSEPEKSLTMSFLFWNKHHEGAKSIPKTPYKIADTINRLYDINTKVVLPNDIYLNGKKLCGLLIETAYQSKELQYIIIGVGINLNNDDFPAEIASIATSIKLVTNKSADTKELINALTKEMEDLYA